jgi:putative zinc finger/helix-turn-helix YgiT family protein
MAVICDYCEEGHLVEESYSQVVKFGRASLTIAGLSRLRCDACDSAVTTAQQYESNSELVRAAEKHTPGYLSPAMLREFREKNGLSQRVAGKLLGVGAGAFGKYETGSKLSAPTAKLIRAALAIPEVVRFLADEIKLELSSELHPDKWTGGKFPYLRLVHDKKNVSSPVNDEMYAIGQKFAHANLWNKQNTAVACN